MGKAYVSFTLGAGRYCLPVEQVVQIVRLENLIGIPRALPSVEGAINVRGDVIPVLDLRPRLLGAALQDGSVRPAGGKKGAAAQNRRRVVITRLGGRLYGLDVDEVREIVDFDDAGIGGRGADAASADGAVADGAVADGAVADGAVAGGALAEGSDTHSGLVAGVARGESGEYMLLDLARALEVRPGAA